MGLFDSIKSIGGAIGASVNEAVNDYKEKKANEEAEREMLQDIIAKQSPFVTEHIAELDDASLKLVMDTAILYYDSFKKEGYADGFDIIEANITGQDISSWAAEYSNSSDIEAANETFYKKFCADALASDWYVDSMVPFYGEDAAQKLIGILITSLEVELPDRASEILHEQYGASVDDLRRLLEDRKYDFYDPFVAYLLNSFEDDDIDDLDDYERNCLRKYINIVRNTRLAKYNLKDKESDVYQIKLAGEKKNYCAAIRNNCLCYMLISFGEIKSFSDLKKYTTLEATQVPLANILYWKECGELKTEVGVKKENAVVNAYAAAKGVVLPKQLEERRVDTRYITLAFEKGQMDLDYACLDAIKKLLPEYAYDRVQVKKPNASAPAAEVKVEKSANPDDDVVAAFEKLEKLKSMNLISDAEYAEKRAELMGRI